MKSSYYRSYPTLGVDGMEESRFGKPVVVDSRASEVTNSHNTCQVEES